MTATTVNPFEPLMQQGEFLVFTIHSRSRPRNPHQELRAYAKARKEFLRKSFVCFCCVARRKEAPYAPNQLHHSHGRIHSLLNYQPWWIPVCAECHDWIGRNPNAARAIGMLCQPGQWNVPPKE